MGARGQNQMVLGSGDADEEDASFIVCLPKEGFILNPHDNDAVEFKPLALMNAEDSHGLNFAKGAEKLHQLLW